MTDVPGAKPPGALWRRLAEGLLLAYLLSLPAGWWFPPFVRDLLVYGVVFAGVMDAATGATRTRLRGLWTVGAFFAVHALTIATSEHRALSLHLSVFTPVVAVVFVVAQRVLVDRAAVLRLYAALGVVAAVVSLDGAVQALFGFSPLTGESTIVAGRVRASLPHPNDLVLVPVLLPFLFEALRARGTRWLVGGLALLGPAVVIALIASKSRNAWLTTAGVALVWAWLVLGWRWALAAVGALALAGGIAWWADFFGLQRRARDFLRLGRDGRIGLFLVAWAMFRESPFLGKGVFTFGEYYRPEWYAYRVRFPSWYTPERGTIPWVHNVPLEMLAERGLAGFAAFWTMIGAACWSVRRRLGEPATAAAVTSLLGFLGASLLDLTLMKDWVALMLFLLLALLWRLGDGAGGETPEAERRAHENAPDGVPPGASGSAGSPGSSVVSPA